MLQEIFRIPFINRPVYGYGLMLVIGFMLGAQLAKYLARRCGYNGDTFINACLLGLVAGVVGARLSHVLESLADPRSQEFARNNKSLGENLLGMLNVSSGGLTFYGGFLLATPVMIWFAIRKSVPLLRGMDIIAPCLMIGLGFGRIGCYLNGCCYGERCDAAWGVRFPYGSNAFVEQYAAGEIIVPPAFTDADPRSMIQVTPLSPGHKKVIGADVKERPRLLSKAEIQAKIERLKRLVVEDRENAALWRSELSDLNTEPRAEPVYPTELYSALNAFLIAAVLMAYFSLQPPPGRVFALVLMLKGTSRYILEMVRVEPAVLGSLSFSMVVSIGLVITGIIMWWACGRRSQRQSGGGFEVVPAT